MLKIFEFSNHTALATLPQANNLNRSATMISQHYF